MSFWVSRKTKGLPDAKCHTNLLLVLLYACALCAVCMKKCAVLSSRVQRLLDLRTGCRFPTACSSEVKQDEGFQATLTWALPG